MQSVKVDWAYTLCQGIFGAKLNKCTRSLGGVDGKGRPYVILLQHVSLEEPEPLAIPSIALACSCSLRLGHEEDKPQYGSTAPLPRDLGHSSSWPCSSLTPAKATEAFNYLR